MGQPSEEWALGGAGGLQAPTGPSMDPFPRSSLPVDPAPHVPWGEVANPALTSLSILLPALNEEDGVAAVLNRIPRQTLQAKGIAYSIHLLDGRSTDRTRAVAKRLGAEVFVQSGNGKGSAFREFVPKIRDQYVVLLDSDGTYPPEVIPDMVGKLGAGSPDRPGIAEEAAPVRSSPGDEGVEVLDRPVIRRAHKTLREPIADDKR